MRKEYSLNETNYFIDRNRLKGKIVESGSNQGKIAEYVGTSRTAMNMKIAGRIRFTEEEITKLVYLYGMEIVSSNIVNINRTLEELQ